MDESSKAATEEILMRTAPPPPRDATWRRALDEYTSSDFHNSMNALINGLLSIHDEITELTGGIAAMRSDLRSLAEHSKRQDDQLFQSDGASRMEALRALVEKQALQIKGLWATLGLLIGVVVSWVIGHAK